MTVCCGSSTAMHNKLIGHNWCDLAWFGAGPSVGNEELLGSEVLYAGNIVQLILTFDWVLGGAGPALACLLTVTGNIGL